MTIRTMTAVIKTMIQSLEVKKIGETVATNRLTYQENLGSPVGKFA